MLGSALSVSINGIMVAVNGILSINALAIPDNQIIIIYVAQKLPPVRLIAADDNTSINPTCCATPTIMNNPVKKIDVGYHLQFFF
jgi:hypothetical protein